MISNNNTNSTPSLANTPASKGTLLGVFDFCVKKIIQKLDNRLPATVLTFNRAASTATVQIQIPMVTTDGTIIPRAQISNVLVQQDGGGGIFVSFPLIAGDMGMIEACDRDISLFLQSLKITAPNTYRMWSFSDGIFRPTVISGFTINAEDANSAVISTYDGAVRIAISQTGIVITTPTLQVNGALSLTGGLTAIPGATGGTIFNGNLQVTGFITAGGAITPSTPP